MQKKIYQCLWVLGVTIAILSAPVGLMRLVGMLWAGHYHKYLIPAIIIVALTGIIFLIINRRLKFDSLSIILLTALFFGSFIGILNFETMSLRYFISHFFGALFMLVVYLYAINENSDIIWFEKFIGKSSIWLVRIFFIVLSFFWAVSILFFDGNLYLGIGTGYLILPFAYYLVHSKFKLSFLVFLLILVSGKRGPLLSGILVFLFFLPFYIKKNLIKSIFITLMTVGVILFLIFITEGLTNFERLPIYLSGPLQKLSVLNPNAESYNEDLAFSGRNQELILASAHFFKSPLNIFTGLGFGWSYFFDAIIQGSTTTDFDVHYVHIAPVNFFLTLGFPLAVLILSAIGFGFVKAYLISFIKPPSKITLVILLFWVGDFANSLSGYSYPIDPLFWLSLAYLKVNVYK